jgi:hypothetical protein
VVYFVYNVSVEFPDDKYKLASRVLVISGIRIENDSFNLSILTVAEDIKHSLRMLYVFGRKKHLTKCQATNLRDCTADLRRKVLAPVVVVGNHAFVTFFPAGPN